MNQTADASGIYRETSSAPYDFGQTSSCGDSFHVTSSAPGFELAASAATTGNPPANAFAQVASGMPEAG